MIESLTQIQKRVGPTFVWCRDVLPFTLPGVLLLSIALWAFSYFAIALNDFFVRSAIFVFLLLVGFLLVSTVCIRFIVARHLPRLQLQMHQTNSERDLPLTLVNLAGNFKWWPLIEVRVESQEPNRYVVVETRKVDNRTLVIKPLRRGVIEQLNLRFWVGDIFGLYRTAILHNVECAMNVLPRLPRLEAAELRLPNEGDESAHPAGALAGDYVDMRRYAPGDPQRFILWKAFAKSRKLLIRTPERAESTEPAVALVLLTCASDRSAADVTRYFIEENHTAIAFGACGLDTLAFDAQSAISLLQNSGQVEAPSVQTVCSALLPIMEKSGGRMVVVGSPSDELLIERVQTLQTVLGIRPYLLLASTSTETPALSRLERWGLVRDQVPHAESAQLHNTVRLLRKLAIPFEVVNPDTGRRWRQSEWR